VRHGVGKQRGLANPWCAKQQDRPAPGAADAIDQRVQHVSLRTSAEQCHGRPSGQRLSKLH
jgi:hypothetical protein